MDILGVKIDKETMASAIGKFENFLKDGRQHYIVTPNPEIIVLAQKDDEFRDILNESDLAIPDGIGIVFASAIIGGRIKERVSGTDLMENILKKSMGKIFLLGGENGSAKKISERFSNIVGFSENIEGVQNEINKSGAEILFVALGAPKQEKWIASNLKKIPCVKVAMGVGGAFDFISRNIMRAPNFLRRIGLEWLWRFFLQPWRIKRICAAAINFPFLVLESKFRR